ncbi:TlpA disulfide reductase family protein [Luteimonas terricola]|uniref:Alkyl hydroperoxide reductase n=1 Tax=Luteimonas terricola TaxID=645597 RepID=A0ABQ2E8Q0_9GAMM|nr:TlpA disulfide reductase family protein [Luteimonas terricola]GGJ96434.1 alkyl hydroperoxide reductase [Luteimonas terricola]
MFRRLLILLLLCASFLPVSAADAVQPRVGEVPPFDLGSQFGGSAIDLRDYRGKVVIVTFWASWCGPCRKELPVLGRFQQAVGRDALEVIAVNVKEPRKEFLAVIRANKDIDVTWVHGLRGRISDSYGVQALPNMFIVDREGKVAAVHRGYSEAALPGIVEEVMSVLPPEVLTRPAGS